MDGWKKRCRDPNAGKLRPNLWSFSRRTRWMRQNQRCDATVAWKELHCVVFVSRCRQPTRSNFDSSAFGRCHLTYTVNHHDRSKKILIWTSIWMFRFFHSFYLENSTKLTSSAPQEVYFQPWLTNARQAVLPTCVSLLFLFQVKAPFHQTLQGC